MRNLIVCADGTWNTPDQETAGIPVPTNVVKLFNCVADKDAAGNDQLRYYHPGVGTEGNWWDKVKGGSVGDGLGKNIMSGYRWLGGRYQNGDHIFLFGFSRGAYTVRSLGGLITRCGLLDLNGLEEAEVWKRVNAAYQKGYRKRRERSKWAKDWPFHQGDGDDGAVPVYFIGVWDTVGALGIPDDLAILNLFDDRNKYTFHDTSLSKLVRHARHAVALDEKRASFTPTLWQEPAPAGTDVSQIWFSGVHADVGGGYAETGLSDTALQWMIEQAAAQGLVWKTGMTEQIAPDCRDVLHDSYRGIFSLLRSQPRSTPRLAESDAAIHSSALERSKLPPLAQAPYRPTRSLSPGESFTFNVYADQPWNETGLYLEAGAEYHFSAEGKWQDGSITCDARGVTDGKFHPAEIGHIIGTLWGKAETLFRNISHNYQAEFRGTKRYEAERWFALMGVVADGGDPQPDGTPAPHTAFCIGTGTDQEATRAGYFYCFANDAWNFYGNNRGSIRLTVTRR